MTGAELGGKLKEQARQLRRQAQELETEAATLAPEMMLKSPGELLAIYELSNQRGDLDTVEIYGAEIKRRLSILFKAELDPFCAQHLFETNEQPEGED